MAHQYEGKPEDVVMADHSRINLNVAENQFQGLFKMPDIISEYQSERENN